MPELRSIFLWLDGRSNDWFDRWFDRWFDQPNLPRGADGLLTPLIMSTHGESQSPEPEPASIELDFSNKAAFFADSVGALWSVRNSFAHWKRLKFNRYIERALPGRADHHAQHAKEVPDISLPAEGSPLMPNLGPHRPRVE
jgi:hypothetical protein